MTDPAEGTIWSDPDDAARYITLRNGVFSFVDGASRLIGAKSLFIQQVSHEEPRVEIHFGQLFPDRGEPFLYKVIEDKLTEMIGVEPHNVVRMGFDGFFHFAFERTFRQGDRQRLLAENIVTFMQTYDCALGASYVVVATGRIEVVCQLFREGDKR